MFVVVVPLLLAYAVPREESSASRILVVPGEGDTEERVDEVYGGLRAAGLLSVELEERSGVDRPVSAPRPIGIRDDARARLQEAKARFQELELDAARAAIDAVVDEILRLERPEDALELLSDAMILRASISSQLGDEDDIRRALVLAARLDPGRPGLHPGLYPPSLVDAYAAAVEESAKSASARMVTQPRIAGFAKAELLVDGRLVAAAGEILAGAHLVTLRAQLEAGTVSLSRIVDLVEGEDFELDPFLAPRNASEDRAALVTAARTSAEVIDRDRALSSLAAACAARAVLFLGGENALLFVPGRSAEELPVASNAAPTLLGRATLAALQAPARVDVGMPPSVSGAPDWVLIGGVAGGLSLVVVGAAVVAGVWMFGPPVLQNDPPPPVVVSCCQ